MRKLCLPALGLLILAVAAYAAAPTTDDQKTLYALGFTLSRSLASFKLTPEELGFVQEGLADGVLNREKKADPAEFMSKIQALQQARMAAVADEEKKAGEAYAAKAATEKGATKTESGLVYMEVAPGTGEQPKATDTVPTMRKRPCAASTIAAMFCHCSARVRFRFFCVCDSVAETSRLISFAP